MRHTTNHTPQTQSDRHPGRAPLAAELRASLVIEVKRDGEETIRKRIGLSRDSFARALGGLTIARGTEAIIRQALDLASPGPQAA